MACCPVFEDEGLMSYPLLLNPMLFLLIPISVILFVFGCWCIPCCPVSRGRKRYAQVSTNDVQWTKKGPADGQMYAVLSKPNPVPPYTTVVHQQTSTLGWQL